MKSNKWFEQSSLKSIGVFLTVVLWVACSCGAVFAEAVVTTTPVQLIAPAGAEYHDVMLRVGLTPAKANNDRFSIGVNGNIEIYNYQNGVETLLLSTNTSGTPSFIKGRQHIVIGTVTDSKEAMAAQYAIIQAKFPTAFVGYDGGWRIYYGSYNSEAEAQSDIAQLSKSFPTLSIVVDQLMDGKVDVVDNDAVVFAYQSLTGQFFIKSSNGTSVQPPVVSFSKTDKNSGKTTKLSYKGGLGARNNPGYGLVLINYLPMEEYLKSVIVDEMGGTWPLEAMKAQAVAARGYAMMNINKHKTYGYDLCNDVDCQVYNGATRETAKSIQAVAESKGIVMTYDNKLINAVYHSNSGGRTESVENVWGSKAIPYLVAVDDPYSANSKYPYTTWSTTMAFSDIEKKLRAAGKDVGQLNSVQVSQFSQNGRALSVVFYGSQGRVELKKEAVRMLLGTSKLRSTWFDVQMGRDVSSSGGSRSSDGLSGFVTFVGRGNGHGLGMSQWGAKGMAEAGYTFDRILATYYTGVSLNYADVIKK